MDINSVIGQSEVMFMFESESNGGNNVYIDDVQISAAVGIIEQPSMEFSMYPNPASDEVRIDLSRINGQVTLSVLDAAGRMVLSNTVRVSNAPLSMPLSGLADGTYTVVLRTGDAIATKPLVVLHAR